VREAVQRARLAAQPAAELPLALDEQDPLPGLGERDGPDQAVWA
jgi:hypothetical protein